MVIVVNTRLLLKDRLEGIGWFTYETLKRITVNHPEHQFVFLFDRPFSSEFVFAPNVTPIIVWPPARHPLLWYIWFELRIPTLLKKFKADVFLSTDGYLSLRTKVPQVLVMHDINFVHNPGHLPRFASKYLNHFFPRYATKAAQLVTVSEYSRSDISQHFGISSTSIDVVYNGYNPQFAPIRENQIVEVRKKYSGGKPYFLFVGALHPRKNIEGLLRSFELYKSRFGGTEKLIIAGGQMFKTGTIAQTLDGMTFRNEVIFTGRLPVEDLRMVYGGALALTFVPFFEGFGVPVLEAFSAGIPVICSNTTSLPEVGADAALYVSPDNHSEIAEAMHRISSDSEIRKQMVEKGKNQLLKFNWDSSAKKLWEIISKFDKQWG